MRAREVLLNRIAWTPGGVFGMPALPGEGLTKSGAPGPTRIGREADLRGATDRSGNSARRRRLAGPAVSLSLVALIVGGCSTTSKRPPETHIPSEHMLAERCRNDAVQMLDRPFATLTFSDLRSIYGTEWISFDWRDGLTYAAPFPQVGGTRVHLQYVQSGISGLAGRVTELWVETPNESFSRMPVFHRLVEQYGLPCRVERKFYLQSLIVLFHWHDRDQPTQLSYRHTMSSEEIIGRNYELAAEACARLAGQSEPEACPKAGDFFHGWN